MFAKDYFDIRGDGRFNLLQKYVDQSLVGLDPMDIRSSPAHNHKYIMLSYIRVQNHFYEEL